MCTGSWPRRGGALLGSFFTLHIYAARDHAHPAPRTILLATCNPLVRCSGDRGLKLHNREISRLLTQKCAKLGPGASLQLLASLVHVRSAGWLLDQAATSTAFWNHLPRGTQLESRGTHRRATRRIDSLGGRKPPTTGAGGCVLRDSSCIPRGS